MKSKLRILYVSDRIPGNLSRGDSQRVTLIYRALHEFADVDMFLLTHPRILEPGNCPWLTTEYNVVECFPLPKRGEWGFWKHLRRFSPNSVDRAASAFGHPAAAMRPYPGLADAVNQRLRTGKYDLVVSRYLQVTAAAGLLDHRPLIIDLDDLDTIAARSRAEVAGINFFRRLVLKYKLWMAERAIVPFWGAWSCAWVCSVDDETIVRAGVDTRKKDIPPTDGKTAVLPNIPIWPTSPVVPPPGNKRLITVASLASMANLTGIDWFIQNVWPAVRRACPTATYKIIGRTAPAHYEQAWKAVDGVEMAGYVEKLSTEYADCDFAVAPILFGAGTKIKVLEAAAYGRTCVTTTHAQRGHDRSLRDHEEIIVSDDPGVLAQACIDLLTSPTLAVKMGNSALAAVKKDYSFDRFNEIVRETVERVL